MKRVQTGLEMLLQTRPGYLSGKRLGLLCNQASIDSHFRHSRELIHSHFPDQLNAVFSPQHGFFGEKQDNMVESNDSLDPALNIPVFSLYGDTRVPTKKMLDLIDILIVDLQDAGTRVYTFIYTLSYCMEAAKQYDKKIVVLDRPNPINGITVEGNCLSPDCASFVGRYPIPMRHGLTIGELAQLFNNRYGIGCDLDVIEMKNWNRAMYFSNTGLPWVAPSPNLPSPASAMVYPGQVIWEGTNISEGRGTTQPFEFFGAPFLNQDKIKSFVDKHKIPGAVLRPIAFEPVSNKWREQVCNGFQIHVTDPDQYKPYFTSLALLQAVIQNHADKFEWKQPPYEYEYERMPIDLILGDKEIRKIIENLDDLNKIEASWQDSLDDYINVCRQFHLY